MPEPDDPSRSSSVDPLTEWFVNGIRVAVLPSDMIHFVHWKAFEAHTDESGVTYNLSTPAEEVLHSLGVNDFACGINLGDYEVFAFRREIDAERFRAALRSEVAARNAI
jgi:hypothetical protein